MFLKEFGPGLIEHNFVGVDPIDTEVFLAFRRASNASLPKNANIRILLVLGNQPSLQYVPTRLEAITRFYEIQKHAILVPAGQTYFFERLIDHFDLNPYYRIFDDRNQAETWLQSNVLADNSRIPPLQKTWLTEGQTVDVDQWHQPASNQN